jgi:Right handed beta helix region
VAITYADYLQQTVSGVLSIWQNVFVRLVSNNTGTAYVSDAATDARGKFTFATKPPGDIYTIYTGPSNTGPWTSTGDVGYAVPVVAGENPAFQSTTELSSGPYVATARAGSTDGLVFDTGGGQINIQAAKYRAIGTWNPVAGTGDYAAAFAQAITDLVALGGGILYHPPGNYRFASQLALASKIQVLGAGQGATILTSAVAAGTSPFLTGGLVGARVTDIILQDFAITGNTGSGAQTGHVLDLEYVDRIFLLRVTATSTGTQTSIGGGALFIGNLTACRVNDCTFASSAIYCVYHNSAQADTDVQFIFCRASSTYAGTTFASGVMTFVANSGADFFTVESCDVGPGPMDGITFQNNYSNVVLRGNRIRACRAMGVEATNNGINRVTINHNIVDYTGVTPLATAFAISIGGTAVTCSANTVLGVVGVSYGIECVNSIDCTIADNVLRNVDEGIICNNGIRCTISGNSIDTCQFRGIRIYGNAGIADDCVIVGNTILNCGQNAGAIPGGAGQGVAIIDVNKGAGSAKNCVIVGNVCDGMPNTVTPSAYYRGISVDDTGHVIAANRVLNVTGAVNIATFATAGDSQINAATLVLALSAALNVTGANVQLDNNKSLQFLDSGAAANGYLFMTNANVLQLQQSVTNGTLRASINGCTSKFVVSAQGGADVLTVANAGDVSMLRGGAFWGHAVVGAQPVAPVTLADVIAIIRGCGLSA